MASTINASTTSTSGLVYNADASGILQLQSNGVTGLTVEANANVSVNTVLQTANGRLEPLVLATAQPASGTSVDFTGIPSWVKRITVTLNGVSPAATGGVMYVRIGNGTVAATGYFGVNAGISGSTASTGAHTTGIWVGTAGNAATSLMYGTLILTLHNASTNTWSGIFTGSRDDTADVYHSSHGSISLSGTLDVLSVVITSSTFDAGTVNIMYE